MLNASFQLRFHKKNISLFVIIHLGKVKETGMTGRKSKQEKR